jgi:Peptidase family S41
MGKSIIFLFFSIILPATIFSQNGQKDIDFCLAKIRNDYPAYLRDKGKASAFEKFYLKVSAAPIIDTFNYVSSLINFFNDQHFQLVDRRFKEKIDKAKALENFKTVVAKLPVHGSKLVGFWINDYHNCVVAIVGDKRRSGFYRGFVVESRENFLPLGTEILSFVANSKNNYPCTFVDPLTGFKSHLQLKLLENGMFTTHYYSKWSKLNNYKIGANALGNYPKFNIEAEFRVIDSATTYVRIPVNSSRNSKIIDSLLVLYDSTIRKSTTLIVDIRNNRGGALRTYRSLFPYIQTSEIIRDDSYRYYASSYLQSYIDVRDKRLSANDTTNLSRIERIIQLIRSNLGKFVYEAPDTIKFNSIMQNPKNIAVIVNYGCVSASEIMILDFIQSQKVKIFGEQTQGVADNLDAYAIETPGKYVLTIPSVLREPKDRKYLLDGKGYTPDVFIPSINTDWIKYVKEFYEN